MQNKSHFIEQLSTHLDNPTAVICFSVKNFAQINHTVGHATADMALHALGQRLQHRFKYNQARLAGNLFAISLAYNGDHAKIREMLRLLNQSATHPLSVEQQQIHCQLSFGIACYPDDGDDPEELIKKADVAMHQARLDLQRNYQFYLPGSQEKLAYTQQLTEDLREAMTKKQLACVYQPQFNADNLDLIGFEVLVRWTHPTLGDISPEAFIPIAEESGSILPLSKWILSQACNQLATWQTMGFDNITIAVNISSIQFHQPGFIDLLKTLIKQTKINPKQLELEITESVAMSDAQFMVQQLKTINQLGIQLSIDDFGTGYSSLAYLQQFPLQRLKIDRAFIKNLPNNPNNQAIVEIMILLGQKFKLKIIAEGIETQAELDCLKAMHCDELQGFYLSKPLSTKKATQILQNL